MASFPWAPSIFAEARDHLTQEKEAAIDVAAVLGCFMLVILTSCQVHDVQFGASPHASGLRRRLFK